MELLKEIKDKNYSDDTTWKTRDASRAVLFDENSLVPLLFVSKYNYHKLPGGGIDEGEDKIDALKRECLEEVGSKIEVIGEVGKIIEFKSRVNLKQVSYCYYGRIVSKGKPNFTEEELGRGIKIVWVPLKDAIVRIKNDKPNNCDGPFSFIRERDLEFLKKAEQVVTGGASIDKKV